jgi:hypothetical protein
LFFLSAAIRHSECRPRIIPTGHAAGAAHYSAGSALEATRVLKADLGILHTVEPRWAYNQASAVRAFRADGFVHNDVRVTFIDRQFVQSQGFFWTAVFRPQVR